MITCCVGNCQNSRQDAKLFKIPRNENRLNVWLQCLESVCDISSLIPGVSVVCKIHFETRFLTSKSRLISQAYPSLFTYDETSSGIPSMQITGKKILEEHKYPQKHCSDHTYAKIASHTEKNILTDSNYTHKRHYEHTYAKIATHTDSGTFKEAVQGIGAGILPSCSGQSDVTQTAHFSEHTEPTVKTRISRLKCKQLNPLCKKIYIEYRKAKKQLSFRKRAQKALKWCQETAFERLTKSMNPYSKKIFSMQINLCTKNKNARRFTTEEKIIALSIMKQSPKCYKFLRRIFILPSKSTLNAMIAKLVLRPGINPQLFNLLKKEVSSWDSKKKMCSIIFDEMSLDTALIFDRYKDCILGFVEVLEKKSEYADHALVFMLRGAVYKWQQPICFYFCQGATSSQEIKTILGQLIESVINLGLNPIALICDQGTSFQSALKKMEVETTQYHILQNQNPDGTINIGGANLNIIFDPPHLLKGLRNNFITKNIVLDGQLSCWQDILDVYNTDCLHTEMRLLHKLNDQCVIPEKIKKMKVKNCVRVFSRTVSAALLYTANFSTYIDGRPVSSTLKNTAAVVAFFDKLFDSVNGSTADSKRSRGKQLKKAVTENSEHHSFWPEAIKTLKKLKFLDKNGREKSVPSIKNFITTLKSFMRVWQYLKSNEIIIMRPRYFNSDPIENFFGQVRAYNYRNNDPNCHTFSCTFKSLLVTRLIKFHNSSFNCEDDSTDPAIILNKLFENEIAGQSNHPKKTCDIENILEQARRERMNTHSRAYTAGWVVKKIITCINCRECQDNLTSDVSLGIHDWISIREYEIINKKRLKYPSEGAVMLFNSVVTATNEYLENNAHSNEISNNIKKYIFSKYSFDFLSCDDHKQYILSNFINIVVKFTLMNWCNTINRILKGTDISRLMKRTILPKMQQKALEKYKRKLRNKSFNK